MPWEPVPGRRESPPAPLHRALNHLMRNFGAPRPETMRSVFDRWSEIMGEGLASHAKPVSLRGGRLVLSVPDPAWATQMRFLEGELLARLATEFGSDEVRSIEVRVRVPDRRGR